MGRQEREELRGRAGKGGETNVKTRKWKGAERVKRERRWRRREVKQGVCAECSERRGSAAHLGVQQFNTRSNEEVRLQVSEHRKRRQECSQICTSV